MKRVKRIKGVQDHDQQVFSEVLKLTLNLSEHSDTTVSGGRLTPEGDSGTDITESECLLPRIDWETLTASLNQQQEHSSNRNVITYLEEVCASVSSV